MREPIYRDHLDLNFDEKIFFFEPINKFYDLPWIRKLAWTQLTRLSKLGLNHCCYEWRKASQKEFENEVMGEISRIYSD